jgi:UDP-glucuronate 4-epimerase
LKEARLEQLRNHRNFQFAHLDLTDAQGLAALFKKGGFRYVVNLAAQAGVRYSLTNPHAYLTSNLEGFMNILEACRHFNISHLLYASSSSVYGANREMPFSVHQNVDHPVSLYAATKKANELLAHSYAANFGLPTTGLRFFTVYGPWGRPDMALFLFTRSILEGKPVDVFNNGRMKRDFTYIDDIVEGIFRLVTRPAAADPTWDAMKPDPATSFAPYRVYNIGNNQPVELLRFLEIIEERLGKKAVRNMLPIQQGDVPETFSDISDLVRDTGFRPATSIEEGVAKFIDWYIAYYKPQA